MSTMQKSQGERLAEAFGARLTYGQGRIAGFLEGYDGSRGRPVPFGGRAAALSRLSAWLDDPEAPYLLLTAPAGRGKSALLVRWCADLLSRKDLALVFLP